MLPTRMRSRAASVALAVLVLAGGCVSRSAERLTAEQYPPTEPAPGPAPWPTAQGSIIPSHEPAEAEVSTPDVLARKAESYSRQMESLLAGRASGGGVEAPRTSGPPQRDAIPSQVKWADASDLRLGHWPVGTTGALAQAQAREPALVRPVLETAPVEANQIAAIVPIPNTVPELAANAPAGVAEPPSAAPSGREAGASSPEAAALAQRAAMRVRDYPRDVSAHLEYQLLQLLLDEPVPQIAALAPLPGEDRELIAAVLDGISLFRSTLRADNNMLLSRKIRPLVDMADRLRSQADLTIPAVALCRSVEGFGKYDPIEPARFVAGAEHRAIIYCELANFASQLNDKQQWETRLQQELVLYTELGVPVWSDRTETIVDAARNRRHDFFINKRIVLPANLTVGRYLLKVTIVDAHANRMAEATVPIVMIVAK